MTRVEPTDLELTEERPPLGRGVIAAVIVLALVLVLMPLRNLSPYAATVVIGFVGCAGLFAAVYYKYRGKLTFNCETAFLTVLALQYLLAPMMARVLSNDFDVSGQTGERIAVKEGYGGGMLVCLLYAATFLLTGAFMPKRAPVRLGGGPILMAFSRRTYLLVIYAAISLWITRMALLATGAFYHLNWDRNMLTDPRVSAWTQYDRGVGPVIVAFAAATMLTGRLNKFIGIGYILVDLFWNFASGGREQTIVPVLAVVATYIVYRNRIPWKAILISIVPGLLLLGFMDYYRYAVRESQGTTSFSVGGMISAIGTATRATEDQGIQQTILRGVARVNDLDSVAAMYSWVPESLPYQNGETYARIPIALVPRMFWPDKPPVMMPINEFFFRYEGGSSPTTTMGEGWLNFGIAGVMLAGFLSAVILHLTELFVVRFLWNAAILPVYIGAIAILARMNAQPMAVWVTAVPKVMLLVVIVHLITRPRRPEIAVQPYEDPAADPYAAHEYGAQPLGPHAVR